MLYKYIHTIKFICNGIEYVSKIESDTPTYNNAIKRCKEKIFNSIGLTILDYKIEERNV